MIPDTLRVVLLIGIIIYFMGILIFLKNKTLELRYTLLWMASGTILLLLVIWPELLSSFVRIIGIQSNMNGLFIMGFAFVIVIMMSLTAIVSKQSNKIKTLIQEIAILEKKIRELDQIQNDEQKDSQ